MFLGTSFYVLYASGLVKDVDDTRGQEYFSTVLLMTSIRASELGGASVVFLSGFLTLSAPIKLSKEDAITGNHFGTSKGNGNV